MGSLTSAQVAVLVIAAALSLITALVMLGLAVVGYFLKDTHVRAKTTETVVGAHTVQIAELRVQAEGVNRELGEIKSDVRTGNVKLDNLAMVLSGRPAPRRSK